MSGHLALECQSGSGQETVSLGQVSSAADLSIVHSQRDWNAARSPKAGPQPWLSMELGQGSVPQTSLAAC